RHALFADPLDRLRRRDLVHTHRAGLAAVVEAALSQRPAAHAHADHEEPGLRAVPEGPRAVDPQGALDAHEGGGAPPLDLARPVELLLLLAGLLPGAPEPRVEGLNHRASPKDSSPPPGAGRDADRLPYLKICGVARESFGVLALGDSA